MVGVEEAAPHVLTGDTMIVPVALVKPQPLINGMLYEYVPAMVGVPPIVMVLPLQVAETPAGKPFAPETPLFRIPVVPAVVWVMLGMAALIQTVGLMEGEVTVGRLIL
jgi:hypothetical protein